MNRKIPDENRATIPGAEAEGKQTWKRWPKKKDIDQEEKYTVSPEFKKKAAK